MSRKLPNSVTVRVPGSTSNCGSGFDTLGLALSIYNDIALTRGDWSGARPMTDRDNAGLGMADEAAALFFVRTGVEEFGYELGLTGEVPMSRGLGSSVTLRAGVVAALNEMSGAKLTKNDLCTLVTQLEGHPDNATAAVLGGFCVARCHPHTGELLGVLRRRIGRDLCFVVASPDQELETRKARGILPKELPYFDAIKSVNSATYVVAAILSGEYDRLRDAVCDFLHEPYRLPLIPGAKGAIEAGVAAGALAGWLSGSGSSVLCVARPAKAARVGRAMAAAFKAHKLPATIHPLFADNRGLRVVGRGSLTPPRGKILGASPEAFGQDSSCPAFVGATLVATVACKHAPTIKPSRSKPRGIGPKENMAGSASRPAKSGGLRVLKRRA
ncbi:MAG: homoserine kinase [Opitutae bacterium]|nr:homoserine kinase [Opitutae bacterium]